MIFKIMLCHNCGDKWFMDHDFEFTNPECSHCENCGTEGKDIEYIEMKY